MADEMSLTEALYVLCKAHTQEDDLVGYTVSEGADIYFLGHGRYVQAWGIVRRAIGQTFEPAGGTEPTKIALRELKEAILDGLCNGGTPAYGGPERLDKAISRAEELLR